MIAGAIAAVLVLIGGVHLLWGLRIWWPMGDEARLVAVAFGAKNATQMPSAAACYGVVALMALGAIWVLMLAGWVVVLPAWLVTVGGVGMGAVFVARGAAAYTAAFARITPQPAFRRMDRRIYGPLCLVLGIGILNLSLSGI